MFRGSYGRGHPRLRGRVPRKNRRYESSPARDQEAERDLVESGGPEAVLDDQGAGLGMVTVALLVLEEGAGRGAEGGLPGR